MIGLFLSSCGTGRPISTTPTITSTSSCDSTAKLPLVDAVLTSEDMITKYPIFKSDNRWTESVDLTNELLKENNCGVDCAKRLWSPTPVSIVLIESNTPERASELVDETRKTFTNILEITDRPYISELAQNAWVAFDKSRHEFVLLYSYGSIFAQIVNRPAAGFDDFASEFDLTYALGKTQNEKLCSSGYGP
jgi:hypothetical protein